MIRRHRTPIVRGFTIGVVAGVLASLVWIDTTKAAAGKPRPGSTAGEVITITGSWSLDKDGGAFTATQENGSATKVQGLEIVNPDGTPVIVNVCPTGQEYAEVVLVYRTTHALDPISGAGSPITGPYVIRTPVMKGIRTKVWGDEVQPLVPVPCPPASVTGS